MGGAVIDLAPPGSKELVVSLFGTNDKAALTVVVARAVLLAGAGVGLLARRRPELATGVILAIVAVGAAASLRQAGASPTFVLLSAALQAGLATMVLSYLMGVARLAGRAAGAGPPARRRPPAAGRSSSRPASSAGLAILGVGIGRRMLEGRAEQVTAAGDRYPRRRPPCGSPGPEASFAIDGLTPVVVPNEDFYRIDTALITPAVELAGWCLRVHGMVDREVTAHVRRAASSCRSSSTT